MLGHCSSASSVSSLSDQDEQTKLHLSHSLSSRCSLLGIDLSRRELRCAHELYDQQQVDVLFRTIYRFILISSSFTTDVMKLSTLAISSLLTLAATNPTSECLPGLKPRPSLTPYPHSHGKPPPHSPPRTKYCYIHAKGNESDDSQTIFTAAKACNHGGVIALMDSRPVHRRQAPRLEFLEQCRYRDSRRSLVCS